MNSKNEKCRRLVNAAFFLLGTAVIMLLYENFTHLPIGGMQFPVSLFWNWILFLLICLFLLFITGSLKLALRIEGGVFVLLGLTEFYLIRFRGIPFLPLDLFSLATAAEVAGSYDYRPDQACFISFCAYAALLVLTFFCDGRIGEKGKEKPFLRSTGAFISLLLIVLYMAAAGQAFVVQTLGLYDNLSNPLTLTQKDGTAAAFLMELSHSVIRKPEGYSPDQAQEYLAGAENREGNETKTVPPSDYADIIVIMDEAFSDIALIHEFETNQDYMPYVHSLQSSGKNCVTGFADVSIVGGNTPNTEYEFLTGNTLAFLPQGCVPFQSYVRSETDAMPRYLSGLGYTAESLHPYLKEGWRRDRVYPLLGFEKSLFLSDMPEDAEIVRKYVSDRASFEKIIDEYEKRDRDKPFFLFNVTMQNHSPFDEPFENFETGVQALEFDRFETDCYLSLIRASDEAFRELTAYFERQERPVVIVLFGDHQPGSTTVEPLWTLAGTDGKHLSDEQNSRRYRVPFVLWTNFPSETENGVETSINYLGNYVLEKAGVPLDPYRCFLKEVSEQYPVISNIRVKDRDGRTFTAPELSDELLPYRQVQYYQMFERLF